MDGLLAHDQLTFDLRRGRIVSASGILVGTVARRMAGERIRRRDRMYHGWDQTFCDGEAPAWWLQRDGTIRFIEDDRLVGRIVGRINSDIRLGGDVSDEVVAARITLERARGGRRTGFSAVWHVDDASSGDTVASICKQWRTVRGTHNWDLEFHRPVNDRLRILLIAAVVVVEDQWRDQLSDG